MAGPVLPNFPLDGRRGSNVYIAPNDINAPRVLQFGAIHCYISLKDEFVIYNITPFMQVYIKQPNLQHLQFVGIVNLMLMLRNSRLNVIRFATIMLYVFYSCLCSFSSLIFLFNF